MTNILTYRDLVKAVEKGDPARAERAMKDHLLYLRDVLGRVRNESESPSAEADRGGRDG